jgi:GAF domain-containing protein
MFQQHMSSLAFRPDDSTPDPARILEEHVLAGLTPDLALDLVLNDLVIRAAEATRATAAALALLRDGELVCRAATGNIARSLDVPLNPHEGLSRVCLQARKPQLSLDTERDPRLDPSISLRLGIRSTLVVPVLDTSYSGTDAGDPHHGDSGPDMIVDRVAGVLEVFSSSVAAFSPSDQKLLEGFAAECAHVSHAALKLTQDKLVVLLSRPMNSPGPSSLPQISRRSIQRR